MSYECRRDRTRKFERCAREAGFSMTDIADYFGITPTAVQWWISSGVPKGRIFEVAELLEVDPLDLAVGNVVGYVKYQQKKRLSPITAD